MSTKHRLTTTTAVALYSMTLIAVAPYKSAQAGRPSGVIPNIACSVKDGSSTLESCQYRIGALKRGLSSLSNEDVSDLNDAQRDAHLKMQLQMSHELLDATAELRILKKKNGISASRNSSGFSRDTAGSTNYSALEALEAPPGGTWPNFTGFSSISGNFTLPNPKLPKANSCANGNVTFGVSQWVGIGAELPNGNFQGDRVLWQAGILTELNCSGKATYLPFYEIVYTGLTGSPPNCPDGSSGALPCFIATGGALVPGDEIHVNVTNTNNFTFSISDTTENWTISSNIVDPNGYSPRNSVSGVVERQTFPQTDGTDLFWPIPQTFTGTYDVRNLLYDAGVSPFPGQHVIQIKDQPIETIPSTQCASDDIGDLGSCVNPRQYNLMADSCDNLEINVNQNNKAFISTYQYAGNPSSTGYCH